jgi:hypothetical protein
MIMRDGDDRSKTFVAGFKDNCSRVVATFRETYTDGTLFSLGELRISRKCQPCPQSDGCNGGAPFNVPGTFRAWPGNQRANLSTGARVLRHEEVQEAGHRDSRSDKTLHKLP